MSPTKIILGIVFAGFGAYSGWVMLQVGYFGIWQAGLTSPAALQILLDLTILGVLSCAWMIRDAQATGRNPWPFVVLTMTAGSFGPLAYLLLGQSARAPVASRGLA